MPTPPADLPADTAPPTATRKQRGKERARKIRGSASDPRLLAIKEAMQVRQREAYQATKEREKAAIGRQQDETRAARDAAMRASLRAGTKPA